MKRTLTSLLRSVYGRTIGFPKKTYFNIHPAEFQGQLASDLIYEAIEKNEPLMVSRMGRTEFSCVNHYKKTSKGSLLAKWNYVRGKIDGLEYDSTDVHKIHWNAGFFPPTAENLDRFAELMLSDIREIDILGSIINLENEFSEELSGVKRVWFEDLNPYYHENPWSRALKGKRILVIHPFADSIRSQYEKRELLFQNKDVLPEFELITYKPVQSIAGNYRSLDFESWFDALEHMKNDIQQLDFDIALIGCGAYGLPLAAFVKGLGKVGIHLGGSIQILFGIIGKRWETEYDISHLVNDHWVRPSEKEVPKNHGDIEDGCYW